jgi:uncharacterized protein YndB with AHSA1/START domain
MRHGIFTDVDDRPAVRFTVDLPHTVDRVWRAVSDPQELRAWFPSTVSYRPRVGAAIEFTDDPNLPPTTGTVLAYEAPHRFAFGWGDDELWFELSVPSADSGPSCRFVLTDVLELRDAAARNAAGWEVCLDALEAHLDGATRTDGETGPHTETSRARWREYYEEYVSVGMPDGAPVPGDGGDDDDAEDTAAGRGGAR